MLAQFSTVRSWHNDTTQAAPAAAPPPSARVPSAAAARPVHPVAADLLQCRPAAGYTDRCHWGTAGAVAHIASPQCALGWVAFNYRYIDIYRRTIAPSLVSLQISALDLIWCPWAAWSLPPPTPNRLLRSNSFASPWTAACDAARWRQQII